MNDIVIQFVKIDRKTLTLTTYIFFMQKLRSLRASSRKRNEIALNRVYIDLVASSNFAGLFLNVSGSGYRCAFARSFGDRIPKIMIIRMMKLIISPAENVIC